MAQPGDPFEEAIGDALRSLPADLRAAMSNVEIPVEDEPPDRRPLPATPIVYAAKSDASCCTRSRITSGLLTRTS